MSLLVPKSKYSRLQIPIGESPGADAGNPLDHGFEEPSNAMPGTLSYDSYRDVARVKTTYNGWQDLSYASNVNLMAGLNGFRLSGEANDTLADGTYTRIYMSPVIGDAISLWTNTKNCWKPYKLAVGAVFYDLSGRTIDLPFDIFCRADPSTNAVSLSVINWTNASTRATDIEKIDGVWVKQGDYSYRYMGSCRSTSATQFVIKRNRDGSSNAKIGLWNNNNRKQFIMTVRATAATWSYDTSTWRPAQGDTNNCGDFLTGIQEDSVFLNVVHSVRTTAGTASNRVGTAPSVNLSTTVQTGCRYQPSCYPTLGTIGLSAHWGERCALGNSRYTWLERGPGGGGTTTWCGTDDGGDTGMTIAMWA